MKDNKDLPCDYREGCGTVDCTCSQPETMKDLPLKSDNEIIADFMGWQVDNSYPDKDHVYTLGKRIETKITFKFDTSWDWLMPVVEKIESLGYDVDICGVNCMISEGTPQGDGGKYFRAMIDIDKYPKIKAVYEAVVEFIWWFNSQKQ